MHVLPQPFALFISHLCMHLFHSDRSHSHQSAHTPIFLCNLKSNLPEMGYGLSSISTHRLHLTVFVLSLLIIASTKLIFIAEGRRIYRSVSHYQDEEAILGAHIGSRPPKCERRCSTCMHCEAIQVPTNPQPKKGGKNSLPINYVRGGDDNSNYKPMSWKCKCGNSIFNP